MAAVQEHLRVRPGLSAMARAVGRSTTTVQRWQRGEASPEPEVWPDLEKYMGVEPGTFRSLEGLAASPPGGILERLDALEAAHAALEQELRSVVAELRGGRGGD